MTTDHGRRFRCEDPVAPRQARADGSSEEAGDVQERDRRSGRQLERARCDRAGHALADGGGGRITLVHVHSGLLRPSAAVTLRPAVEDAEASGRLLERERAETGVDAEVASVVAASPGRGLHEQAERQHADLIVVGSCSRGLLGRVFVGDDARAALNGAPCAVAIAARAFADREGRSGGSGSDTTSRRRARRRSRRRARSLPRTVPASMRSQAVTLPVYAYSPLVIVRDHRAAAR